MPRYLVQRLGPSTLDSSKLIERCGGSWARFEHYANVDNVIKFGLKKDCYEAGQYHIYLWPEGSVCNHSYVTAYKRV